MAKNKSSSGKYKGFVEFWESQVHKLSDNKEKVEEMKKWWEMIKHLVKNKNSNIKIGGLNKNVMFKENDVTFISFRVPEDVYPKDKKQSNQGIPTIAIHYKDEENSNPYMYLWITGNKLNKGFKAQDRLQGRLLEKFKEHIFNNKEKYNFRDKIDLKVIEKEKIKIDNYPIVYLKKIKSIEEFSEIVKKWYEIFWDVNREEVKEIISEKYNKVGTMTEKTDEEIYKYLNYPNWIFYGPPGTGKTYRAKEITNKLSIKRVENNKHSFKHHLKPLTFTTFHPSYNYEDFIEGIFPSIDENSAETRYILREGILKKASAKALALLLIDSLKNIEIKGEKYNRDSIKKLVEKIDGKDDSGKEIKWMDIYKVYLENKEKIEKSLGIDNKENENTRYNKIKEKIKSGDITPYFLIIDEINRGDIPRIFGEIITLIEKDKRLLVDKEDSYVLTLPYSRDEFALPPNLYIIGTMNTSDKSISHFDIALRRRFRFEEFEAIPTDEENENKIKVYLGDNEKYLEVLKEINKILSKDEDIGRDKQIGWAYLKNDNIEDIVNYKIFPLIEEYCWYDDEKLRELYNKIKEINEDEFIKMLKCKFKERFEHEEKKNEDNKNSEENKNGEGA